MKRWILTLLLLSTAPCFAGTYFDATRSAIAVIRAAADTTAPTVTDVTIGTNGTTVTINFSETVVTTGYDNGDFNLDCTTAGANISLNSISGTGSTRTFTAASTINSGDTCNADYVGTTDEIEDATGNDLGGTLTDIAVTNNSTASSWAGPVVVQKNTNTGTNYSCSNSLTGVGANALLVFSIADEGANNNPIPSSSPSLTWTTYQSLGSIASAGNSSIYAQVFTAGGSITASASTSGASSSCVLYEISAASRETTPAGAVASAATPQTAPSVSITTGRADSLVFVVSSDWSAINGTKTWRGSPEGGGDLDNYVNGAYRGYHYYYKVATQGATTVGLSAPTGQAAGTSAMEVRKP